MISGIVLTLVVISSYSVTGIAGKQPPHIVFILADDLGYNDVGYSQYSQCPDGRSVRTPHIDSLAHQGLKFDNSYTNFVCTPSRAAIMTGQYSFRYGLQRGLMGDGGVTGLDRHLKILPQYLKQYGYQNHIIGKWHLGSYEDYKPLQRGFDSFFGYLGGAIGYYTHWFGNEGNVDYWLNNDRVYSQNYSMNDYTQRAVHLINQNADSAPLFLYLSLQAIHAPLDPIPNSRLGEQSLARDKALDLVTVLDKTVGNVVQALKDKNMWQNTVLIFTSDNGGYPIYGGNNYPLRGSKITLWEGGTKIRTFIVGRDVPQGNYDGIFHAVDWLPTLINVAGGNTKQFQGDGVDQWKALKKNAMKLKDQPRTTMIYNMEVVEQTGQFDRTAIRYRTENFDYKLILGNPLSTGIRYDPCVFVEPQSETVGESPVFNDGVLFDMRQDDSVVEENPVLGRDDVKQQMIHMLVEEKKRGYISRFDPKFQNM